MGLIDKIKESLNPDIIDRFNYLYRNHYQALAFYYKQLNELSNNPDVRNVWGPQHYFLSDNMPFAEKKRIVDSERSILQIYENYLVLKKMDERKETVIKYSTYYPRGFVIICNKYLGGVLNENVRMPKEQTLITSSHFSPIMPRRLYGGRYNQFSYKRERSILRDYITKVEDLRQNEIDLLYKHLEEIKIEDEKICIILKKEDEELELIRKKEERARKENEKRNLSTSLPACVASWNTHKNSDLKHKYFFDYYSYEKYSFNASPSMRDTWNTVWSFKNDHSKVISKKERDSALRTVVELVTNLLRQTFGSKTEYLTLVCMPASSQIKTEYRFKEFALRVCKELKMLNAYPYIHVSGDENAKHEGGSGVKNVVHDPSFFYGKYIVLFDDVRTSGRTLERERRKLEGLGATVICAITIAQTVNSIK